jgi:hypothetical protein
VGLTWVIWRGNMEKNIYNPEQAKLQVTKNVIHVLLYIDPQIQDQPYAYVMLIKHGPINFMCPYGFLINAMVVKHVFITCFVAS